MDSATVAQLWTVIGILLTAVLGWIGYSIKAKVDLNKELKSKDADNVKRDIERINKNQAEIKDILTKIEDLSTSTKYIFDQQKDLLKRISDIEEIIKEHSGSLDKISTGEILALDTCLEACVVLMKNISDSAESDRLSKFFNQIYNYEFELKSDSLR